MWEKCVGCGEGLFAGDAFCGNCGRPVTRAVPAAREPDGLESARVAATSDADRSEVRIIPAAHDTGTYNTGAYNTGAFDQGVTTQPAPTERTLAGASKMPSEHTAALLDRAEPHGAPYPPGMAEGNGTASHNGDEPDGMVRPDGIVWAEDTAWPEGTDHEDGAVPAEDAERAPATARERAPEAAVPGPAAARLSGPANLDPARNARYLMYVLRQAAVFTGIYLLIETVLLVGLLLSSAAGTKLGAALGLELHTLWPVALVLALVFWLIPVPALLAEWSLIMEQGADATQTAFEHINSVFQDHGTPVDSQRARTVSGRGEEDREYLEVRRGRFRGYISCFAQGGDLYVGWTFWLYMSPLRLLMMVIGRTIRDVTSRGDAIHRSLRFESNRTLVAAMHGATLAGIDAASSQPDPVGPRLVRETAVDTNFRQG